MAPMEPSDDAGALEEEEMDITLLIEEIRADKSAIEANLQKLPEDVLAQVCSEQFAITTTEKFREVDTDGNGVLTPDELFPVIEELLAASPWAITMEHCVQFTDIFDADGNGSISINEFYVFNQFVALLSFIEAQSPEGAAADEAALQEARQNEISMLIEDIKADKGAIEANLNKLPESVKERLESADFARDCVDKFSRAGKNRAGGSWEATEPSRL